MKRYKSKNKGWEDHYSTLAKKEHFPARSVYKLKEIQQKYNLIKKGDRVLDLGCSPGSWLIYAAELTGKRGQVIGVDLNPLSVKIPSSARIYTADILSVDDEFYELIGKDFNVILSDMAPATTGNKDV
ncbi:MAG: RlmE family RNA methyltransferase, partial [Proteobacteria bacterium]|nr:RlmE family RNA methyltransferase [Pseudomonadota bacterium]